MPPYPGGAMGGVPMSVGDGLSWAWSKFKDNALILVAGIGVWSILSLLGGFNFHVTLNGQEYGVGFGVPFGGYISAAASLFAPMVTANMSLKVATGRPLEWNDLFSFPNVIAGLLAAFLSYVAMIPAALLCGFPAFIVLFLFYYSVYFTVDKGVDGIAGMGASWNILSSHVGELLPFALTGAGRNARIGGATDDYLDVLTDEETDTLSGLLDKLIDALKDRLAVDPDDEPARWMDDARRRMGEERFEVMMRMRQEGFGLGPFGDRGGHSRRERGRGGGSRRRGPDSDSFGECASGDGERGFRSRRSPMAMAREGRFAGRRLRGGRGWNE